jgi:hypothetical protein
MLTCERIGEKGQLGCRVFDTASVIRKDRSIEAAHYLRQKVCDVCPIF